MADKGKWKTLSLPISGVHPAGAGMDRSIVVKPADNIYAEPQPPPPRDPIVKSAPRIKQIYWCDFPMDAIAPEMWKRRPAVILSPHNNLSGCVVVVPCTTAPQGDNEWAVAISSQSIGKDSWAICDKFSSVSVSRLLPMVTGKPMPRVSAAEFNEILSKVLKCLPDPNFGKE